MKREKKPLHGTNLPDPKSWVEAIDGCTTNVLPIDPSVEQAVLVMGHTKAGLEYEQLASPMFNLT